MPSTTVVLDAYVTHPFFTLNAWVISGRHRHHRTRDHFGADSDLYITLDEPVGPWGAGTPVKFVIQDLYDRINRLTSFNHNIRVAWLDAYVLAPATTSGGKGVKPLDAIVKVTPSSSFTVAALIVRGGSATINAWVRPNGRFYLNAFVV